MSIEQGSLSNLLTGPGSQDILDGHKCQGCEHLLTFTNGNVVMVLSDNHTPLGTFCAYGEIQEKLYSGAEGVVHMYPVNFFSTDITSKDAYVHCPIEEKMQRQFPREIMRGLGGCMAD